MKTPITSLIPAIGRLFAERHLPEQTIVGIFDDARYLDKASRKIGSREVLNTLFTMSLL